MQISPSKSGVLSGHAGQDEDDIIPPFDDFEGQNFDSMGEAILDRGCQALVIVNPGDGKLTICHRTNSDKNPYVLITPSVAGVFNGHDKKHTGPVYSSTLKDQGIKWGDIIPPYTYMGADYPGQNFTTQGAAIFFNGCQLLVFGDNPDDDGDDSDDDGVDDGSSTIASAGPATLDREDELLPDTGGLPLWMLLLAGPMTVGGLLVLMRRRPIAYAHSGSTGQSYSLTLPPMTNSVAVAAAPIKTQRKSLRTLIAAASSFLGGSR